MEQNINYNEIFKKRDRAEDPDITNAISHATCMTAMDLKANIILAASETGFTAVSYTHLCKPICRSVQADS